MTAAPQHIEALAQALTLEEVERIEKDWQHLFRPILGLPRIPRQKQILPAGDWSTWLLKGGRGIGKTRTGSETVRIWKDHFPIIHLVGATSADVRDVMIGGPSGILSVCPSDERPAYEPSKRRLTFPNGAVCLAFSAEEPNRLRGPQCQKAWADELAAWRNPDAWDQLQLGLRLGKNPQCIVTTTPRNTPIIRELIADPATHVTSEATFANAANLSPKFLERMRKRYEGTTLGRQELYAELLTEVQGALWRLGNIQHIAPDQVPPIQVRVIGVDPSANDGTDGDEAGLIVVGRDNQNPARFYVFDDLSGMYTPDQWGRIAADTYTRQRLNKIVAEGNQGGEMVSTIIRHHNRRAHVVRVHASRGKRARAEPVAALYEQGRVFHVGTHSKLEDEMTTWEANRPGPSPNRIDALVWAITELDQPRPIVRRNVRK